MQKSKIYNSDFIGLDLLRFLLSLAVLVRHYSNFYYDLAPEISGPGLKNQPFYKPLWLFYNQGQFAVQFFWLISGFIFYSFYVNEISEHKIGFRKFSILRLSRLYPLHFLTLLLVAGLQFIFYSSHHRYFLDLPNRLDNFIMHIFFVGNWFPDRNLSFNVPIWSVSIEVFVYILFFVVTAAGLTKGKGLYVILIACALVRFFSILPPFNDCMLYFFGGCLVSRQIVSGEPLDKLLLRYGVVSIVLAIACGVQYPYSGSFNSFTDQFLFRIWMLSFAAVTVLLFIVSFRKISSKRMTRLFKDAGNMTYSMYLVHFPLQILLVIIFSPENYSFFNNPFVLVSFVVISMVTGWVAFEYFEKPAQSILRNKFLRTVETTEDKPAYKKNHEGLSLN